MRTRSGSALRPVCAGSRAARLRFVDIRHADAYYRERGIGKHVKRNAGRNYFFVELGQTAPPDVREVFRRVALTRRRLSQQLAPDFLYRPNAPILRDTATALDASGAFDWLTFAPVMLGSHKERTEPCPVAIVSTYLVERAMLKTYTGVARRLAVAEQASKQIGPEASRSIAELRRQFHQGLEIRAAETLRGVGMTAVRGLERLDGRQIECGEIDVLAAGAGAGRELIVLICEVKDTDLSFFKDYGPREAFEVARRAHRQAQRKATWVAQHWPRVAGVFQLDAEHPEVQFVAVVVPRITPLPLGGGVASIPLLELGEVGTRVLTEPSSAWRPDLQRARVVASAIAS